MESRNKIQVCWFFVYYDLNELSLINVIILLILGIIHRIFQGEVKVEEQSLITKENADEEDRLLFDVDRGKTFYFAFHNNLIIYCIFF